MSGPSYTPVSTLEDIPLNDRDKDGSFGSAPQPSDDRAPLTKRTVYSSHRIEARTPRRDGETDEQYKRRITSQHINAIMHSIGWVAAAAAVIYYTDLWNVVRYDFRVNHTFLVLGFCSMFVLMMVVAYLAFWVPLTARRPVIDLNAHAPTAAATGAIAGVATFIFFIIALWPIWGWIVIPMMIVLSFAACLGPNLIPF